MAGTHRVAWEVFLVFLRLGFTSFGGPVAHLGYFREELVARRKWLSEKEYADFVALSQFLPGPSSSQVGMAVGASRAGLTGALAAWLGFTAPSALLMILFGYGAAAMPDLARAGWPMGLKAAATAVVGLAVWHMARAFCGDRLRATIALLAAMLVLEAPGAFGQLGAILLGGLAGHLWLQEQGDGIREEGMGMPLSRGVGWTLLLLFVLLLVGLPLAAWWSGGEGWRFAAGFYRSGALIFGGGHVVLPLLQAEFVPNGWVDKGLFLAGYGAAQALPGPLLSFSAFLGTVMREGPGGWLGGLLGVSFIFLPSLLLIVGVLPFWDSLRRRGWARGALDGVNAGVVGLMVAALYHPIWTGAVVSARAFLIVIAAYGLLAFWRMAPWLVVLLSALAGEVLL